MVVFVQISNVGSDAGPFIITANNGASVSPNTFTAGQLISGQTVVLSNNSATIITVTSTGLCTNSTPIAINLLPTTTSSTTLAPTTSTTTSLSTTTSTSTSTTSSSTSTTSTTTSSTSTSTSTSTSSSTTSTTTELVIPLKTTTVPPSLCVGCAPGTLQCKAYDITITQTSSMAGGALPAAEYIDCVTGQLVTIDTLGSTTYTCVCGCIPPTVRYGNTAVLLPTGSSCPGCPNCFITSTTTQPPQFICNCFKITNLTGSPRPFTYVRCGEATATITLDPLEVRYICAQGTPATQVNVLIENLGTNCIADDGISCG